METHLKVFFNEGEGEGRETHAPSIFGGNHPVKKAIGAVAIRPSRHQKFSIFSAQKAENTSGET